MLQADESLCSGNHLFADEERFKRRVVLQYALGDQRIVCAEDRADWRKYLRNRNIFKFNLQSRSHHLGEITYVWSGIQVLVAACATRCILLIR